MSELIIDPEQATPERLTKVLHKKGYLNQGKVVTVKKSCDETEISIISHLVLNYSEDAPQSAPSQLFLKISKTDLLDIGCSKEVEFYNVIANTMTDPSVPRCYDAVYFPAVGKSHLLLDDLSETHFEVTEWPLPPSRLQCERIIDCLAKFHAYWWEHPRLGKDIGELPDEGSFAGYSPEGGYISDIEKRLSGFVGFLGDRLSVDRCKLYEKVLSSLPRLWKRRGLTEGKDITLIHGDPHFWNFLYPHDPDKDKVYIIDWDCWQIGLGASDLAYMIALHWYPGRRSLMERNLLKKYHDSLQEYGIKDYNWDDCWLDYRLSAIENLFIPVWQWSVELDPTIWWPHLERAFLSFQDLGCAELLES